MNNRFETVFQNYEKTKLSFFSRRVKTLVCLSPSGEFLDKLMCSRTDAMWVSEYEAYGSLLIENIDLYSQVRDKIFYSLLSKKVAPFRETLFEALRKESLYVESRFMLDKVARAIEFKKLPNLLYSKFVSFKEENSFQIFYIIEILNKFNLFMEVNILFFFLIFLSFVHILLHF